MSLVSFGATSSETVSGERDRKMSSDGSPLGWWPGEEMTSPQKPTFLALFII